MGAKEFITAVLFAFLSFWTAIYAETMIESYFVLELFIILLMMIIVSGILYSIYTEKNWAWKLMGIFFIIAAINNIFVYFEARAMFIFTLSIIINIVGIIFSFSKSNWHFDLDVKLDEPPSPIYHMEERDLIDHIDYEPIEPVEFYNAKKKALKKKSKKKKSRKKK